MPHVFFDVNVYIDAVIFWNSGNAPTQILFDSGGLIGPPAALLWIAIRNGSLVRGEKITLHASDHVLEQVAGILGRKYNWADDAVDLVLNAIYDLVENSGGAVIEKGSTTPSLQPDDPEDNRVLGDLLDTPAQIFVSADEAFVTAGRARYRTPLFMTSTVFIRALNERR